MSAPHMGKIEVLVGGTLNCVDEPMQLEAKMAFSGLEIW